MNLEDITCPIHSFESFGAVDGPGIRYVIFTQGCNLKCKYCQNRDTWCHQGGTKYSVKEVLDKILRYKNYIIPSGGGVTVSGGEPLLHLEFLKALFTELKKLGYHTALDTSGMFPLTPEVKQVLSLTDLVLLDIKHIDNEKCKELVGVGNSLELNFAKYLSENNIPVWIRQVLVPGYTDDEQDLLRLKDFLSTLKTVEKVQILPYHSMGKYKWEKLGLKYPLEGVRDGNQEDVDRAKKILEI